MDLIYETTECQEDQNSRSKAENAYHLWVACSMLKYQKKDALQDSRTLLSRLTGCLKDGQACRK